MPRKLTNEEVLDTCNKYELEWIDGEYIGAMKPIICKDKNGYIILTRIGNLKYWDGAISPFHTSNPYTMQNIKTLLKNNNYQIELLSEDYKGNDIPIPCKW